MFAIEREFDIEVTTVNDQGETETCRTCHKWPGASASWRRPDGDYHPVSIGLRPVIFDRRPECLAERFAEAIGAQLFANEGDYQEAVDQATKVLPL